MRDRHFMEDENELPFLVNSKRDYETGKSTSEYFPKKREIKNILFSEFPSYVQRLDLNQQDMNNIISSIEVRPKNVKVSIRQYENEITIKFHVKNQYFQDNIEIVYDANYSRFDGNRFSQSTCYFETLDWFKREVKRKETEIGKKYLYCCGIYFFDYDERHLLIKDEWIADARFDNGDDGELLYDIDFEKKVITDKMFEIPFYAYL